jgi:hypothetical protein
MHGRGADRPSVNLLAEVFVRFLRLGCTSFGGPIAHLGYFRREFVARAAWLDDAAYTEIVALCSVLPGPTSSQVGIMIGARRAGPLGGLLAWLAFTTPSAIALGALGLFLRGASQGAYGSFPHGPRFEGALEGFRRRRRRRRADRGRAAWAQRSCEPSWLGWIAASWRSCSRSDSIALRPRSSGWRW